MVVCLEQNGEWKSHWRITEEAGRREPWQDICGQAAGMGQLFQGGVGMVKAGRQAAVPRPRWPGHCPTRSDRSHLAERHIRHTPLPGMLPFSISHVITDKLLRYEPSSHYCLHFSEVRRYLFLREDIR